MRGIFTREERAVIFFLAGSILVGSLVMSARRIDPDLVPGFETEPAAEAPSAVDAAAPGPVDVNTADVDELVRLPGVGPVRAAAILRLREAEGPFVSIDELLEVKGIGPVTLERLREHATVGRPEGAPADTGHASADHGPRADEAPLEKCGPPEPAVRAEESR